MKEISSDKLSYNILQLQNLIKRDPVGYYDEFKQHFHHYQSLLELFKCTPQEYNENVENLIMFMAQVCNCYKEDLKEFPNELIDILKANDTTLDASMRMCIVKALILIRNRGLLDPTVLIKLCFELLRSKDKVLRKHLQVYIITDLKNMNAKHKNAKVNSQLQNFMFKMLSDSNAVAAKMSLDIMVELYRRNIWRDAKTVNAIATACFSKVNKVLVAAHQFFLGVDEEEEENKDSDSEDDGPNLKDVMNANKVSKKSRKRMKILKRTKQVLQKSKKNKGKVVFDFSAIHLLNDPQGMAERLMKDLQSMNERYEIKLLIMNLISRLVGIHELILLNFYPLLVRYLKPHQRDVTKILMFAAQSAHEHVPPDALDPLMRTIADNFISERNSAEVMTVGLNAIRELCIRCPFAINQDLLQDLVQYKSYRNKNVQMAAKSLIKLFRRVNPQILQRKFRGRPTEATRELEPLEFGVLNAKSFIPGTEVLSLEPSATSCETVDDDDEDDDDDSDGWVDVSHPEDVLDCEEGNNTSTTENADKSEMSLETSCIEEDAAGNDQLNKKDSKATENIQNEQDKAMQISLSRILSQEEFKKINIAQLAKQIACAKGHKRKAEMLETTELESRGEVVSLKDIEKLHKRPKPNKEEKLAAIMEGREDREKFGKRKGKKPNCSKTQKEHNKNKAFNMIKHKVRAKQKRSFRDKQLALRNALIKRKKNNR